MKKFLIRACSGIIYGILILLSLALNNTGVFVVVFSIFTILAIVEFLNLTNRRGSNLSKSIDVLGAVSLFVGISGMFAISSALCLVPFLLYLLIRHIYQLYQPDENALECVSKSYMAQMYVSLPMASLACVYYLFGWEIVLVMFAMIWLNDTGAYIVGCSIGRNRLFERISPKKSWEGFFGGLIFSMLFGVVTALWLNDYFQPQMQLSVGAWMLFGALVTLFATWGDLCESLIKRTLDVKDSGNIMPGHGGILDRIDSLLFVAPITLIFCYIIAG